MSKRFVIGDIHGAYKALKQVLWFSGFDYEKDTLIQLGDVADGYPETVECVDELLKIKNLISIRGNHDDWCYSWLTKPNNIEPDWLLYGGKGTVESFTKHFGDNIPQKYFKFFKEQINYYIDKHNNAFIHAGFKSKKGVGHDYYEDNYYWDRDLFTIATYRNSEYNRVDKEMFTKPYTSGNRFLNHNNIFIGHTATTNWKAKGNFIESKDKNQILNAPITVPMKRCNIYNLDTGCGFDGKLTIMDVDTKEYWQSDFVNILYNNYKSRG